MDFPMDFPHVWYPYGEVAALLSSLDAAAAKDHSGACAAALRALWRVVPQRALLAQWQKHLRRLGRG